MLPIISLGEGKKIPLTDIERGRDRAVNIDGVVLRLEGFWRLLETECVAECCGIDAFYFGPEKVRAASISHDRAEILAHLAELRALVEENSSGFFFSRRLNQYFDRAAILQLVGHLIACLTAKG